MSAAPVDRFKWERALLADPDVTGVRLAVLLAVATYMNKDGSNVYVTQRTLAAECGLGERTVRSHLSWAMDAGWLERVRRGHRLGGGDGVASAYRATAPQPEPGCRLSEVSTGTGLPVGVDLNRQEDASQPADDDISTGTTSPPTIYRTKGYQEEKGSAPVVDVVEPTELRTVPSLLEKLKANNAQYLDEYPMVVAEFSDEHGEERLLDALTDLVELGRRFTRPSKLRTALNAWAEKNPSKRSTLEPRSICVHCPIDTPGLIEVVDDNGDGTGDYQQCRHCNADGRRSAA